MTQAVFRVECDPAQLGAVKGRLPGFYRQERDALVLPSPLPAEQPLNEHLVWLWGMLQSQRRILKRLQAEGARLVVDCRAAAPVRLQPNAAEMLHLLGAELRLSLR